VPSLYTILGRARPSRTLFSVLYRSTTLRRLSWLPRWARPRLTDRKRCHRASLSTEGTPDAQTSQRCHSELQESDAPSASECDPDDPKDVTVFHWGDLEKMSRTVNWTSQSHAGSWRAKIERKCHGDRQPIPDRLLLDYEKDVTGFRRTRGLAALVRTTATLKDATLEGPGAASEPRA